MNTFIHLYILNISSNFPENGTSDKISKHNFLKFLLRLHTTFQFYSSNFHIFLYYITCVSSWLAGKQTNFSETM